MSSTASNYDISKLVAGQSIAAVAAVLALGAGSFTILHCFFASIPFLLVTISYAVMMFASSYVEEEQHFWYWTTSGWFVLLLIKRYGITL
jgi:ethanolaminephosphotransferase